MAAHQYSCGESKLTEEGLESSHGVARMGMTVTLLTVWM